VFGDLVSKVYKLCVEAIQSDSYCYKPTCLNHSQAFLIFPSFLLLVGMAMPRNKIREWGGDF